MNFNKEENEYNEYMEYLDELYPDAPDYGLLMQKGDPIAFEIGMDEYFTEKEFRQ